MKKYIIYLLNTPALRGSTRESKKEPLGIYGEGLDLLLASLDKDEMSTLKSYKYLINWLYDFFIDVQNALKFKGYKANHSNSVLYFTDKHMPKGNNTFSLLKTPTKVSSISFFTSQS